MMHCMYVINKAHICAYAAVHVLLSEDIYVIVKERHETIMGYKPWERVALQWIIPIIVELLVL